MKQNLAAAELIPGADRRVISLTRPLQTIREMRAEHLDVLLDFTFWQRLTASYSMMAGQDLRRVFAYGGAIYFYGW